MTIARLAALVLAAGPVTASAHHSHGEFTGDVRELEGELTSVVWRNPHPAMTLEATDDNGESRVWRIQVLGNINGLSRDGVTGEEFRIGERVRITGQSSARRAHLMLAVTAYLEDGTELILGPDESRGEAVYRGGARAGVPIDDQEPSLFRVWIPAERWRNPDLPLTAAARAAKAAWDPVLDDPQRNCTPLGMPEAMTSPHPIEFVLPRDDEADLTLRLEEWDTVRTIHMTPGVPSGFEPSRLGYSVGRWEGETLVVETTGIRAPYFDTRGTPQSDAMEVVERFTLTADGRHLDWTATVTDPGTFTEPVVAGTTRWEWVPGETLQPYECAALDSFFDE